MKAVFICVWLDAYNAKALCKIPFIINAFACQGNDCVRDAEDGFAMDVEAYGTDPAAEGQVSFVFGIPLRDLEQIA